MIIDSFDARTLANMEVALERACETLGRDSELHQVRSRVAVKIVECADRGGRTLGALTHAGRVAAADFLASRHDTPCEKTGERSRMAGSPSIASDRITLH